MQLASNWLGVRKTLEQKLFRMVGLVCLYTHLCNFEFFDFSRKVYQSDRTLRNRNEEWKMPDSYNFHGGYWPLCASLSQISANWQYILTAPRTYNSFIKQPAAREARKVFSIKLGYYT